MYGAQSNLEFARILHSVLLRFVFQKTVLLTERRLVLGSVNTVPDFRLILAPYGFRVSAMFMEVDRHMNTHGLCMSQRRVGGL